MNATCLTRWLFDPLALRCAAIAWLAGAALHGFTADAPSIGNRHIRVALQRDGHLTLAEPGAGQPFATLAWPSEGAARPVVTPFRDARLGSGQRLTVTRADGRQDAVFVLAEQPFAFFQSTLKNGGASIGGAAARFPTNSKRPVVRYRITSLCNSRTLPGQSYW